MDLRHWVGAVGISIATAGLAVSGTLGDVCTSQITALIQRVAPAAVGYELHLFFLTLIVGVGVFFAQTAKDLSDRDEANKTFAEQNRALEEHVLRMQTMPPQEFLKELGNVCESVLQIVRAALASEDKVTVKEAIRNALRGVVTLANEYTSDDVAFGANVMLPVVDTKHPKWSNIVKFVDRNVSGAPALEHVQCLLAFSSELSVPPSHALTEFALPVPAQVGSKKQGKIGGWRVLPGAPFTFALKEEFDFFADTKRIADWFESEGDGFPYAIREEVVAYFGDRPEVSSFVSFPLFAPDSSRDREARTIVGVLNIHWNLKNRLNNAETVGLFGEAIRPLRALTAALIQELGAFGSVRPPVNDNNNPVG